jgi:hypothetical protein
MNDHLSDDQMASVFCRELSWVERRIAGWHLGKCLYCSARQQDLEGRRAERVLNLYRNRMEATALPEQPRAEFAFRLNRHIQLATSRRSRRLSVSSPGLVRLTLSTTLGLAAIASFFFWWEQRVPGITSHAFLARAGESETPGSRTADGVLFQAIRISTPKQTLDRSIYRDLRGRRQVRQVRLDNQEQQLKSTLSQAGFDWDEPLSASGYRRWHDRQEGIEDHIAREGSHLLKLTTKVAEGSVAEQSLTVRDSDFHPVRRTVAFRDSATIEIAEVDFKVIPWAVVDPNLFEPAGSPIRAGVPDSPRVFQLPRTPEAPNADQLEQTELAARLILNQLHADSGEQIEIRRLPQAIEIVGLVDTDERKRMLSAQLSTVSHVKISLQSVTDLSHLPVKGEGTQGVTIASMPDQASPLEIYLLAQGRSLSSINQVAQALFDNALAIGQESKAISELQTRFGSNPQKSLVAAATLSELIYSHHERLQVSLKRQISLLTDFKNHVTNASSISATDTHSLSVAAERNLALCRELTQTNSPGKRSAEGILADISSTMDELTADSHVAYGMSQRELPLSGKK